MKRITGIPDLNAQVLNPAPNLPVGARIYFCGSNDTSGVFTIARITPKFYVGTNPVIPDYEILVPRDYATEVNR